VAFISFEFNGSYTAPGGTAVNFNFTSGAVVPGATTVALTGAAPTVSITNTALVIPATGSLALTGTNSTLDTKIVPQKGDLSFGAAYWKESFDAMTGAPYFATGHSYDGYVDNLTVSNLAFPTNFLNTVWGFTCWIKSDVSAGNDLVMPISFNGFTQAGSYFVVSVLFDYGTTPTTIVGIQVDSAVATVRSPTVSITYPCGDATQWRALSVTFDNVNLRTELYLDGELQSSGFTPGPYPLLVPGGASLDFNVNSNDGFIDDLCIYKGRAPDAPPFADPTPTASRPVILSSVPWGFAYFTGYAPLLTRGKSIPQGSVSLTGFAPQLSQSIMPATGALTLTGAMANPSGALILVPATAPLTLAGTASTTATTTTLAQGVLSLTGYAPTLALSSGTAAATGTLALAGTTPQLSYKTLTTVGTLTLASAAPTVVQNNADVEVVGAVTLTGFAPTITRQAVATPATGALALTGQASTTATRTGVAQGAIALAASAPIVSLNIARTPLAAAIALLGTPPQEALAQAVMPGTATLLLDGSAPQRLQQLAVSPLCAMTNFTGYVPVVFTGAARILGGTSSTVFTMEHRLYAVTSVSELFVFTD
jgi:hypothetical protein